MKIIGMSYFIAFCAYCAMILLANIEIQNIFLSIVFCAIFIGTTYFGLRYLKNDMVFKPIFFLVTSYLMFSYFLKFPAALLNTELIWGDGNVFSSERRIFETLQPVFLSLAPALCLFVIGFGFLKPARYHRLRNIRLDSGLGKKVVFLCISIIIIKVIGQIAFNVGSPIHVGYGLPAPIIALYEFFVQDAAIVLLNVCYFYVKDMANRTALFVVLMCIVANVLLSLSVGWKGELMIQFYLLCFYNIYSVESGFKQLSTRVYVLIGSVGLAVLVLYPYVNLYRFSLVDDNSFSVSALVNAVELQKIKSDSGELAGGVSLIFDRVSGIDKYYPAAVLGSDGTVSVNALFDNSMSYVLKWGLYGQRADTVKSAIGASQFAVYYTVFGVGGLYICSFFLGLSLRILAKILLANIFTFRQTVNGYVPLLAYFFVTVLLTGGNLLYVLKTLFVIVFSLLFLESFVKRYSFTKH